MKLNKIKNKNTKIEANGGIWDIATLSELYGKTLSQKS